MSTSPSTQKVVFDLNMVQKVCKFLQMKDIIFSLQTVCKFYYFQFFNNRQYSKFIETIIKEEYNNILSIFNIKWKNDETHLFLNRVNKNNKKLKVINKISILQQLSPLFSNWEYLTSMIETNMPQIASKAAKYYKKESETKIREYNLSYLMFLGHTGLFTHWMEYLLEPQLSKKHSNWTDGEEIILSFAHISDFVREHENDTLKRIKCERIGISQCLQQNEDLQQTLLLIVGPALMPALPNNTDNNAAHNDEFSFLKVFEWMLDRLTCNNTQIYHTKSMQFYFDLLYCDNEKISVSTGGHGDGMFTDIRLAVKLWDLLVNKYSKTILLNDEDASMPMLLLFSHIPIITRIYKLRRPGPFMNQHIRYHSERLCRLYYLKECILDESCEYGVLLKQLFGYINKFIVYNCQMRDIMDSIYKTHLKKDFREFYGNNLAPQLYDILYCLIDLTDVIGNNNNNNNDNNDCYVVSEEELEKKIESD